VPFGPPAEFHCSDEFDEMQEKQNAGIKDRDRYFIGTPMLIVHVNKEAQALKTKFQSLS